MAMARTEKDTKEWIQSRAYALARIPTPENRPHAHPTLPGLFMRVSPKFKAVYIYRFRGKGNSGTLGEVSTMSLDDAVEEFHKKRRGYQTTKVTGNTLDDIFEGWLKEPKKDGDKKADTSLVHYREIYKRRLKEKGGQLVLASTIGKTWAAILDEAKEVSPAEARSAYTILKAVYRRAVDLGIVKENPVTGTTFRATYLAKASRAKRHTHVQAMNLQLFWSGLDTVANRGHGKAAIRCILLSGWRLNGVLQMRWEQIDFKTGIYTVTSENNTGWKGYTGPMAMSDNFLAYLRERKNKGGVAESEYVFPSAFGGKLGHITNPYSTMQTASKGLGWRVKPHDLRRTFATIAEVILEGNMRLVGRLISHRQPAAKDQAAAPQQGTGQTAEYVQEQMQAERHSANLVANALIELCGVFPVSDEVAHAFAKRGIRIEALELVELEDDEDEAEAVTVE